MQSLRKPSPIVKGENMPRQARQYSESGYMHIYIRGNGKQIIFEDRKDYIYYLNLLKQYSIETNVSICTFCLMENHVHLIVYDPGHNISQMMRKLGMTYAGTFNKKYHRTGHLFDGRFRSVPIESENYLLTAFRYVLNNPRKAGICSASEYPWNSYSRYGRPESFVDTSVFQKLIGSKEEYEAFINAKYEEDNPELEGIIMNDEWALSVIRKYLHIESGSALQTYNRKDRDEALDLLRKKGLTIRQIERLTGINRSVIQRVGMIQRTGPVCEGSILSRSEPSPQFTKPAIPGAGL